MGSMNLIRDGAGDGSQRAGVGSRALLFRDSERARRKHDQASNVRTASRRRSPERFMNERLLLPYREVHNAATSTNACLGFSSRANHSFPNCTSAAESHLYSDQCGLDASQRETLYGGGADHPCSRYLIAFLSDIERSFCCGVGRTWRTGGRCAEDA